ncbi:MAG: hypothetical protein M5F18_09270, partial [Asgard group archaeon]|nr:hypothetical protein [Asgard group archaeon]
MSSLIESPPYLPFANKIKIDKRTNNNNDCRKDKDGHPISGNCPQCFDNHHKPKLDKCCFDDKNKVTACCDWTWYGKPVPCPPPTSSSEVPPSSSEEVPPSSSE